jgi:protein arginine kinase activator
MGGGVGEGKLIAAGTAIPMPLGNGTCAACGFTLEDLRRVRRLGCSECYTTFREELSPMIRGMHKGPSHQGKVPAGLMERQVLRQRLEELRARLDQAVAAESYEEAAGIRDEIRQLNENLVS